MDGQRKKRMQYEFSSTDKEKFSLHDCMSIAVELINDRLIFKIPDGFFCVDYSKDWPNTGNAEVVMIIVFSGTRKMPCEHRFFANSVAPSLVGPTASPQKYAKNGRKTTPFLCMF